MSATVEVLLTENIRHWIRTVLLTADLPNDTRDELRKYSGGTRRASGDDVKRHRTIPFQLLRSVYDLQLVKGVHLHELLEGSDVSLPEPVIPPRSPELEARVEKLKAKMQQRDYDRMTANVQKRKEEGDDSFGQQLRATNKHVIAVVNFVLTVAGSFAFVYKAVEYSLDTPNFPLQMMCGLAAAMVVFFADLYFLIKTDV